ADGGHTAGNPGRGRGTARNPPSSNAANNRRAVVSSQRAASTTSSTAASTNSSADKLTPRLLRLTGSSPRALRGQEGRRWNGPPAGTRTWRRRRDHDGAPSGTRRAAPRDATAPTAPRDAPHAPPAGAHKTRLPRARGAP